MSKNIITSNLKDTDKVKLSYNDKDVEMTIEDFRRESVPYKVWRGLITQTGTDEPTAIVLENTLSGDLTWSYNTVGSYGATLVGEFTEDKTFILTGNVGNDTVVSCNRFSDDVVALKTYDVSSSALTDVRLLNTSIEIKVYE